MTDMPEPTAPDSPAIRPAELAAYLAARMCHDFISPASAIVSGLDLLEDPTAQDMRDDAMGLIAASARKLWARTATGHGWKMTWDSPPAGPAP